MRVYKITYEEYYFGGKYDEVITKKDWNEMIESLRRLNKRVVDEDGAVRVRSVEEITTADITKKAMSAAAERK